mgnify:FL=1
MPIKINFNACDNSKECSGLAICPMNAIYWDDEKLNFQKKKGTLCVDNNKCVSCGQCVSACPIGAIIFAKTNKDLDNLADSLHINSKTVAELFVERYGAEPMNEKIRLDILEVTNFIKKTPGILLIEEYCDCSIQCLLRSIPIETIKQKILLLLENNQETVPTITYYKTNCIDINIQDTLFPVLKIYRDSVLIGQVSGYYNDSNIDIFWTKIKNILLSVD